MWSKRIIEKTYLDRCNIYRKTDVESPNGLTRQQRQLVAEDVPCALSKRRALSRTVQRGGLHAEVEEEQLLFISPEIEVLPGDEIEVIRQTAPAPQRYWAGEPFVYPSHQEIALMREERA